MAELFPCHKPPRGLESRAGECRFCFASRVEMSLGIGPDRAEFEPWLLYFFATISCLSNVAHPSRPSSLASSSRKLPLSS